LTACLCPGRLCVLLHTAWGYVMELRPAQDSILNYYQGCSVNSVIGSSLPGRAAQLSVSRTQLPACGLRSGSTSHLSARKEIRMGRIAFCMLVFLWLLTAAFAGEGRASKPYADPADQENVSHRWDSGLEPAAGPPSERDVAGEPQWWHTVVKRRSAWMSMGAMRASALKLWAETFARRNGKQASILRDGTGIPPAG